MNAWTNLRLATIQADLSARRDDAAVERARSTARPERRTTDLPSTTGLRTDLRLPGWPLSTASRS